MTESPNHYDTLGVPRDADGAAIKKAYRRKRSAAHPDRKGGDHRAMVALNRAFETLSDPHRRARYDETGSDRPGEPSPDDVARSAIAQIFSNVIEAVDDYTDVIAATREHLNNNIQDAEAQLASIPTAIARLKKRRNKIRIKKGKENFLLELVDLKLQRARQVIAEQEQRKKTCERAVELLRDFEYETDQRPGAGTRLFNTSFFIQGGRP